MIHKREGWKESAVGKQENKRERESTRYYACFKGHNIKKSITKILDYSGFTSASTSI